MKTFLEIKGCEKKDADSSIDADYQYLISTQKVYLEDIVFNKYTMEKSQNQHYTPYKCILWYRNGRTLWGCKLERQRFGVGQNLSQHNKSVNRSADKETKSSVLDGCFHTWVGNNSIIKCKKTKLGRKSIKIYRSPPRHCDEMGVINEFITQSFRPLFVSIFIPGYKTAKLELIINFTPLQIIFRLGWTNFFF